MLAYQSHSIESIDKSFPKKRHVVLIGMAHEGFFRNFEELISLLLAAGVDIHIHFSKSHDSIKITDYKLPDSSANGKVTFSFGSDYSNAAEQHRIWRDAIHYSKPAFKSAHDIKTRFPDLQKITGKLNKKKLAKIIRIASIVPGFVKKIADWYLRRQDEKTPPSKDSSDIISSINPDCVIVTPLVNFASKEVDLVKAARAQKITTILATASWDNLTNKGLIKIQPDYVAVWNRHMAHEATSLHDIRQERVWTTGATPFDRWFEMKLTRDRKTFFHSLGFVPSRPLIVYLCSSEAIAGRQEWEIIRNWISAIRLSGLQKVNILIRPHPMTLTQWNKLFLMEDSNIGDLSGGKVWPLNPKHPVDTGSMADYFDTLYHADAVVGLNTSSMIEAAILGKPVLTFLGHSVVDSQTGNLHYQHILRGGFMRQARDLEEHCLQLDYVLDKNNRENIAESCKHFVADFVRPIGEKVNASEFLAGLILNQLNQHKNRKSKNVI